MIGMHRSYIISHLKRSRCPLQAVAGLTAHYRMAVTMTAQRLAGELLESHPMCPATNLPPSHLPARPDTDEPADAEAQVWLNANEHYRGGDSRSV